MSKKSINNKPLEVASWVNKAHEEAMERKAMEEKKRIERSDKFWTFMWCVALTVGILGSFVGWLFFY